MSTNNIKFWCKNKLLTWSGLLFGILTLVDTHSANAENNIKVLSVFNGGQTDVKNGTVWVQFFRNNVDISTKVLWSIEYTVKEQCGGIIKYSRPTPANPGVKFDIYSDEDYIPVGVYTYRIVAFNPFDKDTIKTEFFRPLVVKTKVNVAPVLTIPTDVDTTLAAGLTSLSHLELTGTATDFCTDSIIKLKWEQLDGPSLQNYDVGGGKLVLQDVPVGAYTFKLSATDDGSLTSESRITITIQKRVVSELTWQKAFSPNDDGIDDAWAISNISSNGDLYSVTIVNQQGKVVMDGKPPYVNDMVWDGTQSGKPLPEGAYYFIITNKATREVKKGSILMVR
ncbi:gliding motility-associated C-terminal domain-containing protein [Cytophagaceae bacterium DM2B3-1]|uniref:Gliding motility-associated C-terminal domain-containing protein n=1 Tax=Xanthocytophaga flava TaxID=3048013 RepID=A0ABT7CR99_9BACT|nr:gliding motility-associated C-terminal domain-containing protein [Xanthocytophaga flavus]MDJ1470435.1 gliding motility-associated C-terminal domain-containing protein [Xanthocytophaga flavus]MDJ1496273.1 gliding motility-associated C-terminal domain-containing protein [Xanthocytophaga flavus]